MNQITKKYMSVYSKRDKARRAGFIAAGVIVVLTLIFFAMMLFIQAGNRFEDTNIFDYLFTSVFAGVLGVGAIILAEMVRALHKRTLNDLVLAYPEYADKAWTEYKTTKSSLVADVTSRADEARIAAARERVNSSL